MLEEEVNIERKFEERRGSHQVLLSQSVKYSHAAKLCNLTQY